MRYLKLFENRDEEIHRICREYNIRNYSINSDGGVDVGDNVFLPFRKLKELPLQFGRVAGYFACCDNNLTTLKGSPKYVGAEFDFNKNTISDLEHFPEYIRGGVYSLANPIWLIARHFIYREDRHKVIELFNFSGVIQDGNRVILNRLEYVFDAYDIGITNNTIREIAEYYTIIK